MKINRFKRLLCAAMAFIFVFSAMVFCGPGASAERSLEDMQREYEALEKKIEENEKELSKVQGKLKTNKQKLSELNDEIDTIESQIEVLDRRIDTLNGNIEDLQNNIDTTTNDITVLNSQIENLNVQIAETNALMDETRNILLSRIRENYMAGEATTLEILFSSSDLSSFFARRELMTRVSENDTNLIKELEDKIVELDDLQKQLEDQKAELEEKKTELDSQMVTLNERETDLENSRSVQKGKKSEVSGKYSEVQGIINELDQDSAEYKAAIKKQEKQREALEAQIDEYIRQHGSKQGDTPDEAYQNDGKMMWPVKGKTRMTAGYPTYPSGGKHWGIDICVCDSNGNTRDSNGNSLSLGQPYYAAQGGKVIIAHNDGEWNSGFGNYVVIDHGDGTMTLYAHSQRVYVSVGEVVQKGQKIGLIGETGNVTGPHLHFEVREKNSDGSVSRVQPLNYVSCPGY